jgi:hypothetical protein
MELQALESAIKGSDVLELIQVTGASRAELMQAVEAEEYHILYFAGQARCNTDRTASIALMPKGGGASSGSGTGWGIDWVPSHALRDRLAGRSNLRLVHFSAGYSARLALDLAPFVPAVIGVQGDPGPEALIDFVRWLYPDLLDGIPLNAAVSTARQMVDVNHPGSREWGMPVLYMQGSELVLAPEEPKGRREVSSRTTSEPEDPPGVPDDPQKSRRWKRLKLRLEMYQRTLEELDEQRQRLRRPDPFVESQVVDAQGKISELERELGELESGGHS